MKMPGLFTDDSFVPRQQVKKTYQDSLIEQARSLDLDKVDFSSEDFVPRSQIREKQKVYFWIRVYLKEEIDLDPMTELTLTYNPSVEQVNCKFVCYAKKGTEKNQNEDVINYNPEDDKKVLCLMVDAERIDVYSDDIPFLRTLFRISRWYQPSIIRIMELTLQKSNGEKIDFFDIDF